MPRGLIPLLRQYPFSNFHNIKLASFILEFFHSDPIDKFELLIIRHFQLLLDFLVLKIVLLVQVRDQFVVTGEDLFAEKTEMLVNRFGTDFLPCFFVI